MLASGLAWYAYLPIASRTATTLSWGDPTTLAGFVLVPFALWNRTSFLAERVLGLPKEPRVDK